MSKPASVIKVCSGVRLDNRYEHSIWFASPGNQLAYFAGKVVKTFSAYSYIRKSWDLRVDATMEQAKKWNYLYFQNDDGKTYYYFISNIEYVNDNAVSLRLDLDVIQSYLFDFDLLDCFVERQHTTTDNPGEHTLDEGLELGELVDNSVYDAPIVSDLCILVLASINPNYTETGTPVQAMSGMYDGVFSGLKVWAVNANNWAAWGAQLDRLSGAGFLDGIISMWMYPKSLVKLGGENTWDDEDICKTVDGTKMLSLRPFQTVPGTVDGYTPINKKLLSYPYSFIYVSNNLGGSAVYRFERFTNKIQPGFNVNGALSPDGAVKVYPSGYNSLNIPGDDMDNNYEYGLTLGGFPSCAWDADIYKLWLAQNQNQHSLAGATAGLKIAGGAVATVAGLATGALPVAGAGAMAMVNGGMQIAGHLAQKADMEIQPPQSRGSFSSNVNITAKKHTFSFYHKSISAENARVLDDYFSMYGYKLNRVQTPNIHARPAFTYVKTIGCHIKGNMCTEDIVKVESIFDNGITFWVDGDRVADYSQTNTP